MKAYFMIKIKAIDGGDGYTKALRELEAMPEVEAVEPVSGEYDLVARVEAPIRVILVANKIMDKEWVEGLHILKIQPAEPNPFLDEVCSLPGGESVRWCIQCGTCSGSCPNIAKMDYSPRKTIAMIRAGRRYDVLTSNSMWVCASCYLCTVRCPRGVKLTELMHCLECLAVRHNLTNGRTPTAVMYRTFVDSIKSNGRIYELGLMMKFYLRTSPFAALKMLPVGLKLLSHGRMPLKARKIKGTGQLKAIMRTAQALGGA